MSRTRYAVIGCLVMRALAVAPVAGGDILPARVVFYPREGLDPARANTCWKPPNCAGRCGVPPISVSSLGSTSPSPTTVHVRQLSDIARRRDGYQPK